MTIVAGFVCSDGIVICADSQESSGDYKFPVEKLLITESQDLQVVVGGAGHGPMIDMAAGQISRMLRRRQPASYEDIEVAITDELVSLYEREFPLCPVSDPEDRVIELLVGAKIRSLHKPVLFKTYATTVSRVSQHAIIGSGRAIEYQLYKLYHPPERTNRVIPIAISLLNVAEVVLRSVGGEERLVVLHEGEYSGLDTPLPRDVEAVRRAQAQLESAAGEVLLDLLDVTKSDEDFQGTLFRFSSLAIDLRVSQVEAHRNLMEAMKGLMKGFEDAQRDSSGSGFKTDADS